MLIVDAFNVVHAASAADPRLGGIGIEGLCALISGSRWGGAGSSRAVVVVDGTGGGLASRLPLDSHLSGVRVQFAGPGKDADTAIEALLDDQEHKRTAHRCTVVSSDRRLKAAAAGVRAKWMASSDFVALLIDDAKRVMANDRRRRGGKPADIVNLGEVGLGTDDAAYWMREFGLGQKNPPKSATPVSSTPPKPSRGAPLTPPPLTESERLSKQIEQEWGQSVSPDDLDMGKLLKEPTGDGSRDRANNTDAAAGADNPAGKSARPVPRPKKPKHSG